MLGGRWSGGGRRRAGVMIDRFIEQNRKRSESLQLGPVGQIVGRLLANIQTAAAPARCHFNAHLNPDRMESPWADAGKTGYRGEEWR